MLAHVVHFWEQKEHAFPLLFCVAMDVPPAQASSVPSEQIFSFSKEICTLQCSNLSLIMLEALQVLMFVYKQHRLDFTDDLVANEHDYTICGPVTPRAVDELMAAGNLQELDQLLANSREIDCI